MLSVIAIYAMAQLIVRNLDEEVVRLLRLRAGQEGVSVEEAHRRLLRSVLLEKSAEAPSFKDYLLEMPDAGCNTVFQRSKEVPRTVNFD